MIDKTNFDKTNAWPFVEAKKLLRERKSNIEKKNKIVLIATHNREIAKRADYTLSIRDGIIKSSNEK